MKETVIFLLLVAAVALGWYARSREDAFRAEKHHSQELQFKLDRLPQNAPLDLQEKCARQAKAVFESQGWKKNDLAGYTNHYNMKANKCFMEVTNQDIKQSRTSTFRTVSDAFEGKTYAEYFWQSDKDKKYWEVAPFLCRVTPLGGKQGYCKTTDEFDELIKQFMEQ